MKVKIASVEKIEDVEGKYGPQKKITIKETREGGQIWLNGWIPADKFNADDWVAGNILDLDVVQNGKYWNFKLPTKKQIEDNSVIEAVRLVYDRINKLEQRMEMGFKIISDKIDEGKKPVVAQANEDARFHDPVEVPF